MLDGFIGSLLFSLECIFITVENISGYYVKFAPPVQTKLYVAAGSCCPKLSVQCIFGSHVLSLSLSLSNSVELDCC